MRILVFGDSIVQGSFDTEYGGWVNRLSAIFYKKAIETDSYMNTHSLGIGGETSLQLLKRVKIETEHRETEKRISLILCGTNDSKWLLNEGNNLVNISDFKESYKEIVTYLKSVSDQVFCLGLTRMDESKTNPIPPNNPIAFRNEELQRYETVIQEIAEEDDVGFIKISDSFCVDQLAPDGIHPNAEGHRLIFERVKNELEKANIL